MSGRALARSHRLRVSPILAAGLASALLVGAPPAAANAATKAPVTPFATTTAALPMASAADVVAADDLVFVSGGQAAEQVVVTNQAGAVVGGLAGLPGPTDLLLSNDRRTLYVALPNVNAIAAFDTRTLRELARYTTGNGTCPRSLAQTGRYLWFGYTCQINSWDGNIGRIDLGVQPPAVSLGLTNALLSGPPLLDAPAGNPGVLLAGQPRMSPGSLLEYGIGSDGSLTFLRESEHTAAGANLRDISTTADGATVFTAAGGTYGVTGYSVADLRQQIFMQTVPYPNAVELSRDGGFIASASDTNGQSVFVFRSNGIRVGSIALGTRVIDQGLAWSPDGQRLYAVTYDPWAAIPPVLHILLVVR